MLAGTAAGKAIVLAALAASLPSIALGASIVCSSGATVEFCYDPNDISPNFGELGVVGNAIFATPTELMASAEVPGDGSTVHDSTIAFGAVTVNAKSGYRITGVTFGMAGDYAVANKSSWVSVEAELDLYANTPGGFAKPTVGDTFGETGGETSSWGIFNSWDLGSWGNVTALEMGLMLTLIAHAEDWGASFIQTKAVGSGLVTVQTSPIPIPGALWLFGSGLALLGALNHRRRQDRNG